MASILYKWFFVIAVPLLISSSYKHPVYVSVTEIEHNAQNKSLEVSCKIFTDDFEKTLRAKYSTHVDLLDNKYKAAMDKLVNDYIQAHFKITIDGKVVPLKYLGFEEIEEGIYCYFEAKNISNIKQLIVTNNLLYEYKSEQMGLIHCIVNGKMKNYKLNNPEETAVFNF